MKLRCLLSYSLFQSYDCSGVNYSTQMSLDMNLLVEEWAVRTGT